MAGLTLLLEFILAVFIIYIFLDWILPNKDKMYAKGPFGFPIVGHLPLFGKLPTTTFMRWWKTYGDVFSIRMGSWNTVVVNGYRAVKAAAEHADDAFSGRPNFVTMQILGKTKNGERFVFANFSSVYLKQRKFASKALRIFTSKRPDVIKEILSNEATAFAEKLIRKCEKRVESIKYDVQTLTVRIVFQVLYGRGKQVDIDRIVKAIIGSNEKINEFTQSGSMIDVLPWLQYIMPRKVDELNKLIAQSDNVMLEQVYEHFESFSNDEIRDVTDALIDSDVDDDNSRSRLNATLNDLQAAASETTNTTLAWLFLYMSAFPQVQAKVHAEIDDVVGKGRKVQLNDKPHLVYTNAVIYEVMRIVTQVPFSVPHYAIKDGEIEGTHVDKGTVVIFNLYSVHHERDFWGDPACFRPERLILDNNTLDTDKCNHILPFGIGRRRCVGEFLAKISVFLSFAIVMQKCKFVAPVGESLDLSPIPGLVYSPKDFKVQVVPRN